MITGLRFLRSLWNLILRIDIGGYFKWLVCLKIAINSSTIWSEFSYTPWVTAIDFCKGYWSCGAEVNQCICIICPHWLSDSSQHRAVTASIFLRDILPSPGCGSVWSCAPLPVLMMFLELIPLYKPLPIFFLGRCTEKINERKVEYGSFLCFELLLPLAVP